MIMLVFAQVAVDWSLEELANCPDVQAYSNVIFPFLWNSVFPVILSMSFVRAMFKMLYWILRDV